MVLPVLIGLGVWQLQRMQWKNAMLHTMAAAGSKPALPLGMAPIPANAAFRHVSITLGCPVQEPAAEAGRNLAGQPGWAFSIACHTASQPVKLTIGWHDRPEGWRQAALPSGTIHATGLAVPGGPDGVWRITASSAPPPLLPVAPPTPADIPNNHFAYAIQWFAFAAVLLAIYVLLVRRWRLASPPHKE